VENPLVSVSARMAAVVREAGAVVAAVDAGRRFPASAILRRPGILVTAAHAIGREDSIRVTLPGGNAVSARVAGLDAGTDVAVLEAGTGEAPGFQLAETPAPGALIFAVGRSPERGVNATMGVISTVGGPYRTWRGGRVDQYLRLDLALYPGSSGAAVVDASGALIGMGTAALSRVAPLVIPPSTIDRVVNELLAKGHVSRPYLGVGLQPVLVREGQAGLILISVEPQCPAARAGLLVGDILIALDGKPVRHIEDVQNALEGRSAGMSVAASVLRGGEERQTSITLTERAAQEE
jgi:serine protease Do